MQPNLPDIEDMITDEVLTDLMSRGAVMDRLTIPPSREDAVAIELTYVPSEVHDSVELKFSYPDGETETIVWQDHEATELDMLAETMSNFARRLRNS